MLGSPDSIKNKISKISNFNENYYRKVPYQMR